MDGNFQPMLSLYKIFINTNYQLFILNQKQPIEKAKKNIKAFDSNINPWYLLFVEF
jgi:hypothetical protein